MARTLLILLVFATGSLFLYGIPLCGCSTHTGVYAADMRMDLTNLVAAQESYLADHGTHSRDLAALAFVPSTGVTITIEHADARGWTARATHARLQSGRYGGVDCVAARGETDATLRTTIKQRTPTAERPVVCDLDGWRAIQSRLGRWLWKISG